MLPPSFASPTRIIGKRRGRYRSACRVLEGPGDNAPPAVSATRNFGFMIPFNDSSVLDDSEDKKNLISLLTLFIISESVGGILLFSTAAKWGEIAEGQWYIVLNAISLVPFGLTYNWMKYSSRVPVCIGLR